VSWTPLGPAMLFCPADRPDRFAKAAAAADMVILDLEDGVNASDRVVARSAVIDNLLDPQRTILRVNPVDSADFALDP
jgi:citrate lyase subunit beta/citryl-CoA lyase